MKTKVTTFGAIHRKPFAGNEYIQSSTEVKKTTVLVLSPRLEMAENIFYVFR